MQGSASLEPTYYEYKIKNGDSLSLIMFKMFGVGSQSSKYQATMKYLLALNPHISNPNLIRAGDVLRLGVIPNTPATKMVSARAAGSVSAPPKKLITQPAHPVDQNNFWALSWLEHNSNFLTVPGSIAFGASSNLMSPGNVGLIDEVSDLYAQYKIGKLSKSQYSYQRKVLLDRLKNNIGPIEKLLFGNKTTHESIRIARSGGVPATAHIAKHAARINTLAKVTRNGGLVLAGVGVAASCMQIANTEDQSKKNEILVETVVSTVVGLAGGVMVGVFLVSNPIGWGVALVLATGSAAVSYGAGKVAVAAYDASGRKVDFINGTGVGRICQ